MKKQLSIISKSLGFHKFSGGSCPYYYMYIVLNKFLLHYAISLYELWKAVQCLNPRGYEFHDFGGESVDSVPEPQGLWILWFWWGVCGLSVVVLKSKSKGEYQRKRELCHEVQNCVRGPALLLCVLAVCMIDAPE